MMGFILERNGDVHAKLMAANPECSEMSMKRYQAKNYFQRQQGICGQLRERVGSEGASRAFLRILPTLLLDQFPQHVRVSSLIRRS